jgi:hypothetical protein
MNDRFPEVLHCVVECFDFNGELNEMGATEDVPNPQFIVQPTILSFIRTGRMKPFSSIQTELIRHYRRQSF